MKTVWIIRHGATLLNQEGKARGWSDIPLSPEGRKEVADTAKKLSHSGIDCIYCSDLKRAVQTAKAIQETTGARVIPLRELRTWNIGNYQGESAKRVHPELMKYAKDYPHKKVPNGESFDEFKRRFFKGFTTAVENPKQKIAIVTHRRCERLLRGWIEAGQPKDKSIDFVDFFSDVDPPGHAEVMSIDLSKLTTTPRQRALSNIK